MIVNGENLGERMEPVSMPVSAQSRSQQSSQKERRGDKWPSEAPCARVTDRQTENALLCARNRSGHQGKCRSQHTDLFTEQ